MFLVKTITRGLESQKRKSVRQKSANSVDEPLFSKHTNNDKILVTKTIEQRISSFMPNILWRSESDFVCPRDDEV